MSPVYHPYVTGMYSYVICMLLMRHPHVTRMYSLSSICHSHVIHMSLVCAHMHSYVLVRHSYAARMSFVCLSYELMYHSYVTCMYSYVIRMLLECSFISLFVCHSYVVLHGQINLIKFIELNKLDNFDNFDKIQILRHNRLLVFGIKKTFFVTL